MPFLQASGLTYSPSTYPARLPSSPVTLARMESSAKPTITPAALSATRTAAGSSRVAAKKDSISERWFPFPSGQSSQRNVVQQSTSARTTRRIRTSNDIHPSRVGRRLCERQTSHDYSSKDIGPGMEDHGGSKTL